jgi:acyl carrier protein
MDSRVGAPVVVSKQVIAGVVGRCRVVDDRCSLPASGVPVGGWEAPGYILRAPFAHTYHQLEGGGFPAGSINIDMTTRDELFIWMRDQFAEILEIEPDKITEQSDFADLDADSIDIIEVVNHVEREYNLQVEEQLLYDIETFGDFVDVVEREIAKHS